MGGSTFSERETEDAVKQLRLIRIDLTFGGVAIAALTAALAVSLIFMDPVERIAGRTVDIVPPAIGTLIQSFGGIGLNVLFLVLAGTSVVIALLGIRWRQSPRLIWSEWSRSSEDARSRGQVWKTRVRIWNAGRSTLEWTQVAPADPLRLEPPLDSQMMSATVIARTPQPSGIRLQRPRGRHIASFVFDYLEPGQGAVVEITHRGHQGGVRLAGTLKGLGHPQRWPAQLLFEYFDRDSVAALQKASRRSDQSWLLMWAMTPFFVGSVTRSPFRSALVIGSAVTGLHAAFNTWRQWPRRFPVDLQLYPD